MTVSVRGNLPNFVTKAVNLPLTPCPLYTQVGPADRVQASHEHTHLYVHHSLVALGAVDPTQTETRSLLQPVRWFIRERYLLPSLKT